MMQSAESVVRNHAARSSGMSPAARRSLPQSQMRAILVIVVNVFGEQSLQMGFVRDDDVIQHVTPATRHPSLRHTVLPRTLDGGSDRSDFERSHHCRNLNSIFAITVEDQESRRRLKRKRFSELLNDPGACWMFRDVEVQNPPTVVADDEETVEQVESNRWNCEEVHRRDGFPMIP